MSAKRYRGEGGQRIDQFLTRKLEGSSRSHVRALIERGAVLVDGRRRAADFRLKGDEVIELDERPRDWRPEPFEDWILHEDAGLLVLRKPSGLIVHPMGESWLKRPHAALEDEEPNLAGLLLKHRPQVLAPGMERCGIVHRLDRPTSGVLLVAKTPEAQERLLHGFRQRLIDKVYRAAVLGTVAEKSVEAPIGRAPRRRKVKVTPFGREASTGFRTVAAAGGVSLVEARPLTGRTHQIRAHLAVVGNPVLGDAEFLTGLARKNFDALGLPPPPRLMLHAYRILLDHPVTGKPVSFTAAVPEDFSDYWKACRASCAP